MGISKEAISLLHSLKVDGHLGDRPGAVMEIGRQQLNNSFLTADSELKSIGEAFGVTSVLKLPKPLPAGVAHGGLESLRPDAPDARPFWNWLGYRYAAIDVDGSPDVLTIDLNFDPVPSAHRGRYQLVTNFGTTEHVANQMHAFKVIHDLTAQHGVMIHAVPSVGMLNHGLINYNPKFFWMLARSNGYAVLYTDMVIDTENLYGMPENIVDACEPFEPDFRKKNGAYRIADGVVVIVLQKRFDLPYVAPLDVPTGIKPLDRRMAKRYWTLFNPDPFADRSGINRFVTPLKSWLKKTFPFLKRRKAG